MEIKIPKITVGIKDAIKDPEARCNRKAQEIAVKNAWAAIYTAVASGDSDIAYWGDKPVIRSGFYSFMRYALHRSPKQDGFLQLSVMEIRNGETIPTSDSQHDNVEDFISRRAWGPGAEIVTILYINHPPGGTHREKEEKDMLYGSHMEEKYNLVEQILVWSREYTREQLNSLNLPKIREIYNNLEFKIISRVW